MRRYIILAVSVFTCGTVSALLSIALGQDPAMGVAFTALVLAIWAATKKGEG